MSYYDLFLLLHVYFFVQKCLHVPKCCKYFILSSVILPLNVEGTSHTVQHEDYSEGTAG